MFEILCEVASTEAKRLTVPVTTPIPVLPLTVDQGIIQPVILYPYFPYPCQSYPTTSVNRP